MAAPEESQSLFILAGTDIRHCRVDLGIAIFVGDFGFDVGLVDERLSEEAVHVFFECGNAVDNLGQRWAFGLATIRLVLGQNSRSFFNVGQELLKGIVVARLYSVLDVGSLLVAGYFGALRSRFGRGGWEGARQELEFGVVSVNCQRSCGLRMNH